MKLGTILSESALLKINYNKQLKEGMLRSDVSVGGNKVPLIGSCRLMVVFCSFLVILNVVFCRVSFTYNYLCMSYDPTIPSSKSNMTKYNEGHGVGTFQWTKTTAGYILSSYYIGYVASCIFGGFVSDVWGGRKPVLWGNFLSVIFMVLSCPAVYISPFVLFICRLIGGFFSGLSFAPVYTLFAKWLHPSERTLLIGFTFSGFPLATIITYPVASLLCKYGFRGWESNFYVPGLFGCICHLLYCRYVYDNPTTHPRISAEERTFLSSTLVSVKSNIPWVRLCTSTPIIAYFISQSAQVWNWQSLAINLPTYYKEVFYIQDTQNALASSSPFMGLFVIRILISVFFRKCYKCSGLTLTRFRKNNHLIGTIIPSAGLLILTFLDHTQSVLAVILVTIDQSIVDFAISGGFLPSLLELAPQYSGIITGIAGTVAFCSSIASPILTGYLTKHHLQEEWNKIFYIQIGFLMVSCIFYELFGSSERLKWLPSPVTPSIERIPGSRGVPKETQTPSYVELPKLPISSVASFYGAPVTQRIWHEEDDDDDKVEVENDQV